MLDLYCVFEKYQLKIHTISTPPRMLRYRGSTQLGIGFSFSNLNDHCRLLAVDPAGQWADVEPGIVLDDLNAQLRPRGLFFAPETSTSTFYSLTLTSTSFS